MTKEGEHRRLKPVRKRRTDRGKRGVSRPNSAKKAPTGDTSRRRADARQNNPPSAVAPATTPELGAIRTGFREFQARAKETNHFAIGGPSGAIAPMFGLASETGSILDAHKRYLRQGHDFQTNQALLRDELGDLMWYVATVATAAQLDLGEIAERNIARSRDLYPPGNANVSELMRNFPQFDKEYLETERFPRRLVVEFLEELDKQGSAIARVTLIEATPNHFPNGPILQPGAKPIGYKVNAPLGARLTDNTRRVDGYRYHDAIHFGFMAVLGWSPTIRDLLRIKRKSDSDTDVNMDGARAIYSEEGLAAILSRLAPRRMNFVEERTVDGSVIEIAKAATMDLEVSKLPGWLWRRAISQGFAAMSELTAHKGGFLTVDLDERVVKYAKVRP